MISRPVPAAKAFTNQSKVVRPSKRVEPMAAEAAIWQPLDAKMARRWQAVHAT